MTWNNALAKRPMADEQRPMRALCNVELHGGSGLAIPSAARRAALRSALLLYPLLSACAPPSAHRFQTEAMP